MGRPVPAQDRGRAFVVFALGFMLVVAAAMALTAGTAHAAGFTIIDQTSRTNNNGQATSQSGGNTALGNNSDNAAIGDAVAVAGATGANGSSLATNSGGATNTSDGTANISTGNASSTGATSTTTTSSSADVGGVRGFVIVDQSQATNNVGRVTAVTGNNDSIGNNSFNTAVGDAVADAGGVGASSSSVATNDGAVTNRSDGRAGITTGNATASGVNASTTSSQTATGEAAKNGFALVGSDSRVNNVGTAFAVTGGNDAIGNNSFSRVVADPRAFAGATGPNSNSIATNTGTVSNHSDGSSTIDTGNATATGTHATTNTTQTLDLSGGSGNSFALADQNAPTNNVGRALGRSGLNFGAGNNTFNTALASRRAFPGGVGDRSQSVASNTGGTTNDSNGTTRILTGDVISIGTDVSTIVRQLAA